MTIYKPNFFGLEKMERTNLNALKLDSSDKTCYKICSRCVMDTSDPEITFNANGECNHCTNFFQNTVHSWFPNDYGKELLFKKVDRIKALRGNKKYDCVIGLSGGVDSSYLALKVKELGLRPLAIHVDAGWNSELAVSNIEAIINYCEFDLYTHVVDWEEMRALQVAYLRSAIPNQDVPQDHIFFSMLYKIASKHKINFILSGGNVATECIFPDSWHGNAMDSRNLLSINRKFGTKRLWKYKTVSFFEYYIWFPVFKKMETLRPLDFMPYSKAQAIIELEKTVGYKQYRGKHGESLFTKFFQNFYLPQKFGYDKRRPHLSSMIVSGNISRKDALLELKEPLFDNFEINEQLDFICRKLRISKSDFDAFLALPNRTHAEFANWDAQLKLSRNLYRLFVKLTGFNIDERLRNR